MPREGLHEYQSRFDGILVQGCHIVACTIAQFLWRGIAHGCYRNIVGDGLACKRMVAIYGQFAIFHVHHTEDLDFSVVILKFYLCTNLVKLWWYIIDIIGEGEFLLVFTKTFFRRQWHTDGIPLAAAFEGVFNFLDNLAVSAMNVVDWQIDAFQYLAAFVGNGVGEGDVFAFGNSVAHAYILLLMVGRIFTQKTFRVYSARFSPDAGWCTITQIKQQFTGWYYVDG